MSAYLDCATEKGVYQHIRDGESCRICKEWVAAGKGITAEKPKPKPKRKAAPRKPKATPAPRRTAKCGTPSGLRRHYTDKTEPCDPCLESGREYQRERRAKNGARKNRKITEREHGTMIGVGQHVRAKEPVCRPCKDARNAYQRHLRATRYAA